MVFSEKEVNLREDTRQTKELKRIADRVRKLAIRDFPKGTQVAVIVATNGEDVAVKLGVGVEEEVIEEKPTKTSRKKKK